MMLKAVLLVCLCGLVMTEAFTAKRKDDTGKLSGSPIRRELLKLANILKEKELNDATGMAESQTKRRLRKQRDYYKDCQDNDGEDFDVDVVCEGGYHGALKKTKNILTAVIDVQDLLLKFNKNKEALIEAYPQIDESTAIINVFDQYEKIKKVQCYEPAEEEEEEEEGPDDEETE